MNAISPVVVDPDACPAWDVAARAVNLWRGEMIHWFSRGEAAVSETLLSLTDDRVGGEPIRLRQLFGQRLEDLRSALSVASGPPERHATAVTALDAFRDDQAMRALLCHGRTKIWLDRNGRWAVGIELLEFSHGKEKRTSRFITHREAETLLTGLRERCRRLEAALAQVRAR